MELAWAAGILDGEGAVTVCRGRRRLAVKMHDEESVRRFASAVGVGKVYGPYGPYPSSHAKHPFFTWIAEEANAFVAARLLIPYVGSIRRTSMVRLWPELVA